MAVQEQQQWHHASKLLGDGQSTKDGDIKEIGVHNEENVNMGDQVINGNFQAGIRWEEIEICECV